jgi:hypothetical protein
LKRNRQQNCQITNNQTGCICKGKIPGEQQVIDAQVATNRAAFLRIICKSNRLAARQLKCHTQLLRRVTAKNKDIRYTFFSDFLPTLEDDQIFTATIAFSDETTFHLSGNVIDIIREFG